MRGVLSLQQLRRQASCIIPPFCRFPTGQIQNNTEVALFQSNLTTCFSTAAAPQASAKDPADVVLRKAFAHCVRNTRESEYESYIWAGQIRKEWRPTIFALRAFHIEIASIADHVKETLVVPMRMQWWRDAVNSLYKGTPIRHPVIQCLAQVNERHPLTRYHLQKIISARQDILLNPDPPATLHDLETFSMATQYRLLRLQLEGVGLGGSITNEGDEVLRNVGIAVGLAALLKGTGHNARKRRLYLPADMCQTAGLDAEELFAGHSSQQLQKVAELVATRAQDALTAARSAARQANSSVNQEANSLMLPAVAAGLYLNALAKHDFDLFSPALSGAGYSTLRHQISVKWHLFRNTF